MNKFLLFLVFFGLLSGIVSAQQLELKEVITRSARGIEETLPQKAKVAVLNFESPAKAFSEYVIEELTTELLEVGKITVVDRKNLATIMEEMKFQYSGNVSDESMVSIGKMIGAQYIISGTLTDMETYYRFRIRIINVETAAIQRQITNDLKNNSQVAHLLGGKTAPTSNVRDNWVSAEVSGGYNIFQGMGLGIGARYERMFGYKTSLGANFYWFIPFFPELGVAGGDPKNFDRGNIFGIDAFVRYYPAGGKFFLGLALGYHDGGNYCFDEDGGDNGHGTGFAITGEMGWKIDVGKEGGFFVEPGFLGTFIIGNHDRNEPDFGSEKFLFLNGYFRFYLGAGYAF